jgi:hypothetical protein
MNWTPIIAGFLSFDGALSSFSIKTGSPPAYAFRLSSGIIGFFASLLARAKCQQFLQPSDTGVQRMAIGDHE